MLEISVKEIFWRAKQKSQEMVNRNIKRRAVKRFSIQLMKVLERYN